MNLVTSNKIGTMQYGNKEENVLCKTFHSKHNTPFKIMTNNSLFKPVEGNFSFYFSNNQILKLKKFPHFILTYQKKKSPFFRWHPISILS